MVRRFVFEVRFDVPQFDDVEAKFQDRRVPLAYLNDMISTVENDNMYGGDEVLCEVEFVRECLLDDSEVV